MQNDEIFKKWGVTSEEVFKEINESCMEIMSFASGEAEMMKHFKASYVTRMTALLTGSLIHFMNILKESSVNEKNYKEIAKNIKENLESVLEENEKE